MPPLNKFQKSCIAIAVGQALVPTNLQAATITVDAPGTMPGCNIYDAFASANNDISVGGECVAGSGADTIALPFDRNFNLEGTVNIDEVGLLVSSSITVQGNGSTISGFFGDENKRLIDVTVGGNLNLNNIELKYGHLSNEQGLGAAIRVTSATLTTNSVTIRYNGINDGMGGELIGSGGAVHASDSMININYSNIYHNSSANGGGIFAENSNVNIYRSKIGYNNASKYGGAIYADDSPLLITDSNLNGNSADKYGGAIYAEGENITIINGLFDNNLVGRRDKGKCCIEVLKSSELITPTPTPIEIIGGVRGGEGGAIFASGGELSISESTFNNNRAGEQGSAIKISHSATLTADKSSFHNNTVVGYLDGMIMLPPPPPPPTPDLGATLHGGGGEFNNSGYGGAISISGDAAPSHSIVNSTLSGNQAPYGGAILLGGNRLDITNTTIVGGENNKYGSRYGGEANIEGNAIFAYGNSTLNLANSVISHAVDDQNIVYFKYNNTDLCTFNDGASLNANIHNFFQDGTCGGEGGGDPRLSRLSRFSNHPISSFSVGKYGDSRVRLPRQDIYIPLFDSPLQNAGDFTVCASSPVGGKDQRNIDHAESHCDIGAIDSRNTNIIVNHTGDEVADSLAVCTLRDALISTLGGEGGSEPRTGNTCGIAYDQTTITFDPIVFPSNGQTTITLASTLPSISQPVSITGPGTKPSGLTVMADGTNQIFRANRANLYMSGMTLSGGEGSYGGAMSIYGSVLTLDKMTVSGNSASEAGGGLRLVDTSAYITNSTISDNLVNRPDAGNYLRGGGISLDYNGFLVMTGSTVSGNSVGQTESLRGGEGGGIKIGYTSIAVIHNSTISGNTAQNGGGLLTSAGIAYVTNTTVSDNYAVEYGGGISLENRYFGKYYDIPSFNLIQNSIISGNTADGDGNEIANAGAAYLKYNVIGNSSETFSEAVIYIPDSIDGHDNIFAAMDEEDIPLNKIIKPLSNSSSRRTQTHDLVSGSPAIDNGKYLSCTYSDEFLPVNEDQLGRARNDGACDIGSIEFDNETFYTIKAANGNVIVFSL